MKEEIKVRVTTQPKTEADRLHDYLERINTIMWLSHMIKGKGLTSEDGNKIMDVLDEWASE